MKLKNEQLSSKESASIEKDIHDKDKSYRSKESQAASVLPSHFTDVLEEELDGTGAHAANTIFEHI